MLAILQLDRLFTFTPITHAVMTFYPNQVMCCWVFFRELPDDMVWRHLVLVRLVSLTVDKDVNLVLMSVVRMQ